MATEWGADHQGVPWPDGWRRTARRARLYESKGTAGVETVDVDIDGLRERALLLPVRRTSRLQGVMFAVLAVVFLVLALGLLVASVAQRDWENLIGVLLLGGIALVFGTAGAAGLLGRRDVTPGVRLSPTRMVFHAGVDSLATPWENVSGIRLSSVRYGIQVAAPRPWHNWLVVEVHDPSAVWRSAGDRLAARLAGKLKSGAVVSLPDKRFAMDPVLAYHVVRHYLERPGERDELGGERAVDRIKRRQFG